MASQAIKEYDDFAGQDGYLIVDGLTDNESGGKMKVPNYAGVTDGYVLTKTTTNGSDDVVWSAPAGGGSDPFAGMTSWVSTFNGNTMTEYFADPENPTHLDDCELEVNVKTDNGVVKHQYLIHAGSASFEGPWAS